MNIDHHTLQPTLPQESENSIALNDPNGVTEMHKEDWIDIILSLIIAVLLAVLMILYYP